jgi:hypothetical protein
MTQASEYIKYAEDIKKYPDEKYNIKVNGFDCEIKRNVMTQTWNGYVYLTKAHPFYGKNYLEIQTQIHSKELTYSDYDKKNNKYCIGFDHSHCDDFIPGIPTLNLSILGLKQVYFTYEDLIKELEDLTKELIKIK